MISFMSLVKVWPQKLIIVVFARQEAKVAISLSRSTLSPSSGDRDDHGNDHDGFRWGQKVEEFKSHKFELEKEYR